MPNYNPHKNNGGRVPGAIKKGEVRNPKGSSEWAKQKAKIKRLTIDELSEVSTLILRSTREELVRTKDDPDISILQCWVMSLVTKSVQKGDAQTFDVLMNRLVGKVPEAPVTRAALELEREANSDAPTF